MTIHPWKASSLLAWSAISTLAVSLAVPAQPAPLRPGESADLVIVPEKGQSPQQEWTDRYACYDWARQQSGFDPAASGGTASAKPSGLEQYRRAAKACLEGRGYAVHEVPAGEPPVAAPVEERPRQDMRRSRPVPELLYHPLTMQIEGGYSISEGSAARALDNGWNVGLGLTWTPTSALPLSLRIDGSYSRFSETDASLGLASQATGANIAYGYERLYGGDADARLDLRMGPRVREYFFGGIGWYRAQTTFKERTLERGLLCFYYCYLGYFPVDGIVSRTTSGWLHAWNAGVGFEFALEDPASLFIEARYLRLSPSSSRNEFVPIRVGLRF
jgi:opacity protein-like surface antigen